MKLYKLIATSYPIVDRPNHQLSEIEVLRETEKRYYLSNDTRSYIHKYDVLFNTNIGDNLFIAYSTDKNKLIRTCIEWYAYKEFLYIDRLKFAREGRDLFLNEFSNFLELDIKGE